MKSLVVDASVVVKWVVEEEDTDIALSLFRFRLLAPDLLMLECSNVLWSRQRRREISPAQADTGT